MHQDLLSGVVMHAYGFYTKREHHEGGLRQHLCDEYLLFNIYVHKLTAFVVSVLYKIYKTKELLFKQKKYGSL